MVRNRLGWHRDVESLIHSFAPQLHRLTAHVVREGGGYGFPPEFGADVFPIFPIGVAKPRRVYVVPVDLEMEEPRRKVIAGRNMWILPFRSICGRCHPVHHSSVQGVR